MSKSTSQYRNKLRITDKHTQNSISLLISNRKSKHNCVANFQTTHKYIFSNISRSLKIILHIDHTHYPNRYTISNPQAIRSDNQVSSSFRIHKKTTGVQPVSANNTTNTTPGRDFQLGTHSRQSETEDPAAVGAEEHNMEDECVKNIFLNLCNDLTGNEALAVPLWRTCTGAKVKNGRVVTGDFFFRGS